MPRALKIHNKSDVAFNQNNYYLFNEKDSTAIRVPKGILNTLAKIQNLPNGLNHVWSASLANAINLRHKKNISIEIEHWKKFGTFYFYYPRCAANTSFHKSVDVLVNNLGGISNKEADDLVRFFAKCPHDYDVSELICPNVELQPVTT